MQSTIQHGWDIPNTSVIDIAERCKLWESLRSWFLDRGYTLYTPHWENGWARETFPTIQCPENVGLPYSYSGGSDYLSAGSWKQVAYAQDSQGRHVAIKFVVGDSEEYRIMRFLHERGTAVHEQGLIPILEFLSYDSNWFVVMPRWGTDPEEPPFSTIREALVFMHCLLKAIDFLHENLIVHRDIKVANILVNHMGQFAEHETNTLRPKLRAEGCLTYVLCDFDCSMMFSPTKQRDFRLDSDLAYEISVETPEDTLQGELDYDPFIFEMGCLGILFMRKFQQCTRIVPLLAPLIDRLITRNLNERFTASEALQFFENMHATLTDEQLAAGMPPKVPKYTLEEYDWRFVRYDRWAGLPADFVEKWSSYRAPPRSLGTRLLQKICLSYWPWGCRFLRAVRRIARYFRFLQFTIKPRYL